VPVTCEPAARAVVSDDGSTIRLVLYRKHAWVEISLVQSITLAGQLLEAACLRLCRIASNTAAVHVGSRAARVRGR
jgi:hypothetical protein